MTKNKQTPHHIALEYREYKLSDDFPVLVLSPHGFKPAFEDETHKFHFHNCIEIGFCYEGEHRLTFDSQEYRLQTGDFFVLPPYSMHYVNHIKEPNSFCCEYLYLKPAELLKGFYPLDIPTEMHWYRNSDRPFLFSKASHPHIHKLLMLLLKEYHSRMEGYQLVIKGLAQTLMAELTRELSAQTAPPSDKFQNISSLLPALKLIHSDYTQSLRLSALAEQCHLSASTFHALFLEQLGESPGKYITRIRLQKACELLYSTELSVLDVAIETGFSSLSNFYRCFHDNHQISPKKWRDTYRSIRKKDVSHSLFHAES